MRERFGLIYVGNPGNSHLISTAELQHFTDKLIIAKPLDTNVGLISTVREFEATTYKHLVPKVTIHDHYLNKPGVGFLTKLMPRLQAKHKFLDSVQMYLVEKNPIEDGEAHRLDSLRCGMIFDLGVHLLSILEELVPLGAKWENGPLTLQRVDRTIAVKKCVTGRFGGSFLGMSTVVPDRRAETFGIIEFLVTEKVASSAGLEVENLVPVLMVVGKGVPVARDASRDLKAIQLSFQTRAKVVLDIDTHRFQGIDDAILREEGYYDLDFTQKGINSPLVVAAENGFDVSGFQGWSAGSRSVLRLYEGLVPAGDPIGYDQDKSCRDLVSMLLQEKGGFTKTNWTLPDDLRRLFIGPDLQDAVP